MPAENQTVNPSFNITSANTPSEKPHLFVQVGRQGVSFIQLDIDTNTSITVLVYHFTKKIAESNIAQELNLIISSKNLLQHNFKKIFVFWCFDENILVPNEYFDAGNSIEMMELVYGDGGDAVLQNEKVLSNNVQSVYKIPIDIKNVFNTCFPFCIQNHQNSIVLNLDKNNKNLFYCNFYSSHLTVLLRKNGQLQILQNFEFNTPEDAVYLLLNVCQNFKTDATQTSLTVSGMIDADSNLYIELYKYFLNIDFAALPECFNYSDEIKNYPAHYFSHLFATASCVL